MEKGRNQSGFSTGSFSKSTQDCDVLTTEDCSGSDDEDSEATGLPSEFFTYWREAVAKSSDCSAWTKLITYVEKEKNLTACRKAYEAYLTCFPLSHIYWRKYTDMEQQLGTAEEAEKIFIRAVKSNPLNVTLWTSYILFLLKQVNRNRPKSAEKLQGAFSEAVDACGLEYRSDELWTLYIEHEIKHGNFKQATALYNRVLNIPTQRYQLHFDRFNIFVSSHSPIELLTMEELLMIYTKIQAENDNDQTTEEDLPLEEIADSLTDSDLQKIRQHILDTRKQMHLLNEVQVQKRSAFEDGIKRLYFSASPLSVKQLQNWRVYLKFEKSQGCHERIVILYERCLMPCAKYEEFWLSYARYMEEHSVDAAGAIFERACRIHLPLKFTLHLQWALFEEKHGQLDSAHAIYRNLENVLPGVTMVRLRHVNFMRRIGNLDEAERLLREAAQNSCAIEKAAFYTVKLARLVLKLRRDPEKARDILIEGLKKEPNSPYLHQCLLDIEISRHSVDDVLNCVERALNSNINDDLKGILSQRRLEYLEDCGNSLESLLSAYNEHQTLLRKQEELKRTADEKNQEGEGNNKKAKTRSTSPSMDIPGVSQPSSKQSVTTKNTPTTVSSAQKPVVNVPKTTRPVLRPPIRPYIPPHRPPMPVMPPMPHMFRGPIPPSRMSYIPPMPPPHMGGPPGPFPPYSQGPWFQNLRGYGCPQPWNYNRFYPPF